MSTAILLLPIQTEAHGATPWQDTVSYICIDAETGRVIDEHNATLERPPASMLKLMQMLLVAEGLEDGRWTLEIPIRVTRHARHMGGTQVWLDEGEAPSLGHLMKAIAVASANDAAMAVAEGLWGSEEAYLKRMNAKAAELSMAQTRFTSVHGLPPRRGHPFDQTTALDMARLARAAVAFPQILQWTSTKKILFRPGETPYRNTNKLLWRVPNCDGLKTGYIRAAGFCLTATAQRKGRRAIAVVMGYRSSRERFRQAERLLTQALKDPTPTDHANAGLSKNQAPAQNIGTFEPWQK